MCSHAESCSKCAAHSSTSAKKSSMGRIGRHRWAEWVIWERARFSRIWCNSTAQLTTVSTRGTRSVSQPCPVIRPASCQQSVRGPYNSTAWGVRLRRVDLNFSRSITIKEIRPRVLQTPTSLLALIRALQELTRSVKPPINPVFQTTFLLKSKYRALKEFSHNNKCRAPCWVPDPT